MQEFMLIATLLAHHWACKTYCCWTPG